MALYLGSSNKLNVNYIINTILRDYKNITYNDDNTMTLVDGDGIEHTISCVYDDGKITGITCDNKLITVAYDNDQLVSVNGVNIDIGNVPINSDGDYNIEYSDIVYNEDNTITLTEVDGTVHIMTCEYDGDKIVGFTYDDDDIKLAFDGDKLVKVDDMDVDVDNMPISSGNNTFQLITDSSVISVILPVTIPAISTEIKNNNIKTDSSISLEE